VAQTPPDPARGGVELFRQAEKGDVWEVRLPADPFADEHERYYAWLPRKAGKSQITVHRITTPQLQAYRAAQERDRQKGLSQDRAGASWKPPKRPVRIDVSQIGTKLEIRPVQSAASGRYFRAASEKRERELERQMQERSAEARKAGVIDAKTLLALVEKLPDGYVFPVKGVTSSRGGTSSVDVTVTVSKPGRHGGPSRFDGKRIVRPGNAPGWYAESIFEGGQVPGRMSIDFGQNWTWDNPREVFASLVLGAPNGNGPKPRGSGSSGKSAGRRSTGLPKLTDAPAGLPAPFLTWQTPHGSYGAHAGKGGRYVLTYRGQQLGRASSSSAAIELRAAKHAAKLGEWDHRRLPWGSSVGAFRNELSSLKHPAADWTPGKPSQPGSGNGKSLWAVGDVLELQGSKPKITIEILTVRPNKRRGTGGWSYTVKQSNVAGKLEFDQNTLRPPTVRKTPGRSSGSAARNGYEPNLIYESSTADYTALIHYAKRDDGQWFKRIQGRGPRGYRWGAWQRTSGPGDRMGHTGRKARLPKAPGAPTKPKRARKRKQFDKGDRVRAGGKTGTVASRRMGPPDYAQVEAYSVVLDERINRPGYAGTMFKAADVKASKTKPPITSAEAEAIQRRAQAGLGRGFDAAARGFHTKVAPSGVRGYWTAAVYRQGEGIPLDEPGRVIDTGGALRTKRDAEKEAKRYERDPASYVLVADRYYHRDRKAAIKEARATARLRKRTREKEAAKLVSNPDPKIVKQYDRRTVDALRDRVEGQRWRGAEPTTYAAMGYIREQGLPWPASRITRSRVEKLLRAIGYVPDAGGLWKDPTGTAQLVGRAEAAGTRAKPKAQRKADLARFLADLTPEQLLELQAELEAKI
jgi:hypothetical protein